MSHRNSSPRTVSRILDAGVQLVRKSKRILKSLDVPSRRSNVLNNPAAMAELEKIGVQTVPIVTQENASRSAQQLGDVANFVNRDVNVSLD